MKRVADLEGAELDLWVAKADGVDAVLSDACADGSRDAVTFYCRDHDGILDGRCYRPSKHWGDGGPLLEKYAIGFHPISDAEWQAEEHITCCTGRGATPLIAAMRAFVASKFGETVDEVSP